MRSMSSASSPSGFRPCGAPASQIASQTAGAVVGVAEDLVAELAACSRCARRRSGCRRSRRSARPGSGTTSAPRAAAAVGGAQTSSFRISRLGGPWTARLCSSSVDGLTHTLQAEPLGELACSQTPSYSSPPMKRKLSCAEPEDGRVVDHPAGLVADRRVDDLADRQPADVARDRVLHERLGVRAEHLPLAQRREVHHGGLLAAGPVLGDGALVVEAVRQPVAAVLDEVAGQLASAGGTPSPWSARARPPGSRGGRWPSRSGSRVSRRGRGRR